VNQNRIARKWNYTNIDGTEGNHSGSVPVAYPRILFGMEGVGGSTNSVDDRGQRERGSGGGSPLVRGFWRQL